MFDVSCDMFNPFVPTAPYEGALELAEIAEKTQALMGYTKNKIFVWSRISKFLRPAQRYCDFKLIRITCQAACHGKTEHGIFVKFKKPSKTAVVLIAGVTISGTPCPRHIIVPFGAEAPSGHVAQA